MKPPRNRVSVVADRSAVVSAWWRKPWGVGGAILVGLVLGLGWVGWNRRVPPLPVIDLSRATPGVRRTVETHGAALRAQPRSAWAWGRLGSVLYAYRLNAPALQALAEAERLDPKNPRWPYLQAMILNYSDPSRAVERLRRTVDLVGSRPWAPRWRLARALAEQGRWNEARPEIEALLTLEPLPTHALLLAAQDARQQGDFARAVEQARQAASDAATAKPASSLLASLLARLGDHAGAEEAARRARTAPGGDLIPDPFDFEALALREDPTALSEKVHPLMAGGRLAAAAEIVDRMMQEHADYPDTWLAAGRLEILRRDLDKAEAHLRKHLRLEEGSVQGWFQLGMALLGRNQNAEAVEAFGRAVQLKPDLGPAWHNRGLALGRLGRVDEALEAFQQVFRCSPEHVDAYVLAADLQVRRRNAPAALALLDQASRLNPSDPRLAPLRQRAESLR